MDWRNWEMAYDTLRVLGKKRGGGGDENDDYAQLRIDLKKINMKQDTDKKSSY